MWSLILIMIMLGLGTAAGAVSSTSVMKNEHGERDKILWGGMISMILVSMVVYGIGLHEAAAFIPAFFAGLGGGKIAQHMDPRIRQMANNLIETKTKGIVKAALRENASERKRRLEVMPLARSRRDEVLAILEHCQVDSRVTALRGQINAVVNNKLPALFARRPVVRDLLSRARATVRRDEKFPSTRLDPAITRKSHEDIAEFEQEIRDIDESVRMYLRLLDHLVTDAGRLRLEEGDVVPEDVNTWATAVHQEFDQMLEAQREVSATERQNGSPTRATQATKQRGRVAQ